jgi:trigger factor
LVFISKAYLTNQHIIQTNFIKSMKADHSSAQQIVKINIHLEPEDYLTKYKAELQKVKNKVSLKGFRQGKTPDHVVAKMYGENVMSDILNNSFSKTLDEYITENKIEYVCQPLIAEGQEMIEIDLADKTKVYTMSYEVGEISKLDIAGISSKDSYTSYAIQPDPADIAKKLDELAVSLGTFEPVADNALETDKIEVSAVELEHGMIKKDGWQSSFDFHLSSIPEEEQRSKFIGLQKGDHIQATLSSLTRMSPENIRKEWLQADDEREIGDDFQITVETVLRKTPVELTDEKVKELYETYDINTIADLRARYEDNASHSAKMASVSKLYDDMYQRISNDSVLEYSDTFAKRWLKESEQMDDAKVEDIYEDFKKDLKWSIIQRELQQKYQVQLNNQEINNYFHQKAEEFMQQFGFFDQGIFDKVVDRMKKDKNEYYKATNILLSNKIFENVEKEITKVEESITESAFKALTAPKQTEEEVVS